MSLLSCRMLDVSIAGIRVVSGLSLELANGEVWGLLGANGVGKTTLLKCLAGLNDPDAGAVYLGADDISGMRRRDIARRLGMLQQHTVYLFDSSVLEIALTGRHPHMRGWQRESPQDVDRAQAALEDVDLAGFAERGVTSLSGGEARRLAFAGLLVQDPEVLLLDEPTNHLDLRHQGRIMAMTAERVARDGRTAIAALHDVNLAAQFCTHVLLLHGNGEWQAGPRDELLNVDSLSRLYGCAVERIESSSGPRFHCRSDVYVANVAG